MTLQISTGVSYRPESSRTRPADLFWGLLKTARSGARTEITGSEVYTFFRQPSFSAAWPGTAQRCFRALMLFSYPNSSPLPSALPATPGVLLALGRPVMCCPPKPAVLAAHHCLSSTISFVFTLHWLHADSTQGDVCSRVDSLKAECVP